MMQKKVIITSAVTGAGATTEKSKHVPVTPKEIAEATIHSAKAGGVSHDANLYKEVVERVRESDTDVVLNITAGGGGDWIPSPDNPAVGGEGTWMQTPEERHKPIGELLPEICTLDIGSINFGDM